MKTLETHEISKTYRGRRVVDDVTVHVQQGEVVGLLGPNGAGKTTAFRMIAGLVRPDSGRISVDGADITHLPAHLRARRGIGYLPQKPSVIRELAEFLLDRLGRKTVRANRRADIARLLAMGPSFLLFDEPFSGIEAEHVLELRQIIFDLKRSGIGILVTDHNVRETLAVTDRAYIMNNGRIFRAGSPQALGRIQ